MRGQTNNHILRNKFQRDLRNSMTEAECMLWQALRGRQMGGLKFRRQHPFDDYILDFICLEKKLIVEVDGGQHGNYGESDALRTEHLVKAGFKVIRFWNHEVLGALDAVRERIWLALQ